MDPDKSATVKLLKQYGQTNTREVAKALPMYWGPQPFTAGPMYIGAITVFLFVLGLCLPKGKTKWWVLIPSVLGILLALGGAYGRTDLLSGIFRGFNKFWFDTMPFYNKFRTVSMALVILQFTFPILGFLALDRVLKGHYDKNVVLRSLSIATAITAGFCLLCWLFPGFVGTFHSASDSGYDASLAGALADDRKSLMRGDALSSLLLILATAALIFWSYRPKSTSRRDSRSILAGAGICIMLVANMFVVGKRYLNSSHFVSQRQFDSHFTIRDVDKYILADEDPSYRVLDLTVNVFNDATPSYWHKNIGGYSPVKFQRYQDLIDRYLTGEISSIYASLKGAATLQDAQDSLAALPVLSALNCKYIILDAGMPPLQNPQALGSAWFVDKAVIANTADEEIALLDAIDMATTAVLPSGSSADVLDAYAAPDSTAAAPTIAMTEYAPNQLRYHYSSESAKLAVFSEIWCPYGWTAWLEDANGTKVADVTLQKADWALRSALLPAGDYDVVMRFEPQSYKTGRTISAVSSWTLLLLLLAALGLRLNSKK